MPRFRFIVQIYKTYEVEAADIAEGKNKVKALVDEIANDDDRYNINEPRNLDKPKKKFVKGGEK